MPLESEMPAFEALESLTTSVSLASSRRSWRVRTNTAPLPAPAGIVSVPEVAAKSAPARAVRCSVAKRTVIVRPLGRDSATSRPATWPSRTPVLRIESLGAASSSAIVPLPCASEIEAALGSERLRVKVSLGSSSVSSRICTAAVREVDPAGIVTVPVAAA